MRVTEITVTFSSTIPVQAFGNVTISGAWKAELDETDKPVEVQREIYNLIRSEIASAVKPIAEAKRKVIDTQMSTLPKEVREQLAPLMGAELWLSAVAPEIQFAAHLEKK